MQFVRVPCLNYNQNGKMLRINCCIKRSRRVRLDDNHNGLMRNDLINYLHIIHEIYGVSTQSLISE